MLTFMETTITTLSRKENCCTESLEGNIEQVYINNRQ